MNNVVLHFSACSTQPSLQHMKNSPSENLQVCVSYRKRNVYILGTSTRMIKHAKHLFASQPKSRKPLKLQSAVGDSRFMSIASDGSTDSGIVEQETVTCQICKQEGMISLSFCGYCCLRTCQCRWNFECDHSESSWNWYN